MQKTAVLYDAGQAVLSTFDPDEVLQRMNKGITTDQILMTAAKTREHGIIPEFSFIFGDPDEPEVQQDNTFAFIRKLKTINPQMELIILLPQAG